MRLAETDTAGADYAHSEDDDVSIDGGDNELDRLGLKYMPARALPHRGWSAGGTR